MSGMYVTLPGTCAFCRTDFGEKGPLFLSYCIAWEGGVPCSKPFCPQCSTEEHRREIRCPDHLCVADAPIVVDSKESIRLEEPQ